MNITITKEQEKKVLHTVMLNDSGYNAAWLDGYKALALELDLIKWDYKKETYVINRD